jgi:hypothetical protein
VSDTDTTGSKYINETDELILRAAAEIMRRTAVSVTDVVWGNSEISRPEIVNLGGIAAKLTVASDAIDSVIISFEVNAASYPEPQSLRV